MTVLDRSELQASSLADLHAIADQLGLEGFRRMRKAELIDAILSHGSGEDADGAQVSEGRGEESSESTASRTRRSPFRARRARRGRTARDAGEHDNVGGEDVGGENVGGDDAGGDGAGGSFSQTAVHAEQDSSEGPVRSTGSARSGSTGSVEPAAGAGAGGGTVSRERGSRSGATRVTEPAQREERTVTGVVELLGNGSAFLRVNPPESSDEDVYISAAQVRRCELVSGDRVSGPLRTPRRSERYPSLVRVETINDVPAGEVADAGRYEDRPVAYASELLSLEDGAGPGGAGGFGGLSDAGTTGAGDSVLQAIARLAPFGRGSRVLIVGPPRSGKTTVLRRLLSALVGREGLDVALVLVGVRPEEIAEHGEGGAIASMPRTPLVALSFAASADTQDQAVIQAVETAKRIAARGGDALVLIDTLDGLHPHTARKVMAGARNLRDGGSLTIIATATRPLGGETTIIALDPESSAAGGPPSLDPRASGTVRAELLTGQ